MQKKVRELKQILRKVGFRELPGKRSHTNWVYPLYAGKLIIAGKDSSDAKRYQEKALKEAISEIEGRAND